MRPTGVEYSTARRAMLSFLSRAATPRLCPRRPTPSLPCTTHPAFLPRPRHPSLQRNLHTLTPNATGGASSGSRASKARYTLLSAAAASIALLTPSALAERSDHIHGGPHSETTTPEQRMLLASTSELEESRRKRLQGPEDAYRITRIWRRVLLFWCDWVYEPLATTLRFAHLVVIFVPVLATIPVIYVGERLPKKSNERTGTLWWYTFLINSMERAGPTFIKLGQWAATRSDIFPTELCDLMARLHSNVDAHPLHYTKRILEKTFDDIPFSEIFTEFDPIPLGIGAIAQVYKAKLNPSLLPPSVEEEQGFGEALKHDINVIAKSTAARQVPSSSVAVKVLHPGVEKMVHRDLCIMHFFASAINAIPTLEWLSLPDEVVQFGEMMRLQLDLRIEGNNLNRFRANFKARNTVTFPKPYLDYTTREVLIEEFAHGIPLSAFLELGGGVFQKDIADLGLDAFLHMLLLDNFIHADLHPGNIMVRFNKPEKLNLFSRLFKRKPTKEQSPPSPSDPSDPQTIQPTTTTTTETEITEQALNRLRPHLHNRSAWLAELAALASESFQPQLIFIDTGLVTELNALNRSNFLDLFRAIAEFDGYRAGVLMMERCKQPECVLQPELFALKMQHLVLGVKAKTFALGQIKIGDVLNEVLGMVRAHHVRMEGDFVNVVISILLLEGIGRALDPEIDLFKTSLPMLRQLGAQSGASMMTAHGRSNTSPSTSTTAGGGGGGGAGAWTMLKVWLALETRQLITSTVEDVEKCVQYDLLSPNI
ncbi:atypical/ABC1/ABC1-C protein kinase [Peziza echinospora]|nr:atypical/ABC1/ABC1-C protein kinase [Peziza echinospora]